MNQQVNDFFSRFERASRSSDFSAFEELYAVRFMFGGPEGIQVVEREDFLKMIPRMKAKLSSMGLFDSRVQTVEAYQLDSRYFLAKTSWKMGIRGSSWSIYVDVFATYVLERGIADAMSIIFQIDHQDLATVIAHQRNLEQGHSMTGQPFESDLHD
jgi:hypothetical protein